MLILACLPIGDVRDASAHLIESIAQAKYIAAEDSRKFARLCSDLDIKHNAKVNSWPRRPAWTGSATRTPSQQPPVAVPERLVVQPTVEKKPARVKKSASKETNKE